MIFQNARIFGPDCRFHDGSFQVRNGIFENVWYQTEHGNAEEGMICSQEKEEIVDLHGATVIPGLIDIHTHGNSGADFSDGDYEGLVRMARFYAKNGITSFAPTSMTLPYDVLELAFSNAKRLKEEQIEGAARMQGIHMEGPYFSYRKRGAQNADYLKNPDLPGFRKLYDHCGGNIAIVDLAPELPGAAEFATQIAPICTVSEGHTDSDYEHAKAVYEAGAGHLIHLFNAMPGIHHRNPGVIEAAAERQDVTAEIICDGYHIHPASVRLAFSLFGAGRIVLISDSGRCAGMPEGSEFTLGGQKAHLENGVGRLEDGTIACSAANLWQCMINVMRWGIREEDAVRAATCNPASVVKKSEWIGSIEPGKLADFVVTDKEYQQRSVYLGGKKIV